MEEWKEYKLSEVATLTTGYPFDGHKYGKEGIRVVRGDNVTIGSLRWDIDKDKRWNEPFERASEFSLYADDIVIGMDGSRVGKNRAQVKQEDLPLYIAQRVACIRHNKLSLQSFLYYQIFNQAFENYIKAVQTGTSIPHVSLKQIGDYPIILPSLKVQQSIASILKSLDDKIEVNRRINDNLEQQAQALFKSWFVDFEPFKEGEFVESESGMIPKGWRVGKLGDFVKTTSGGTPSRKVNDYYINGNINWVKSKELQNSFIAESEEKITDEAIKKSSAKLLPTHSVLIAMYGATVGEFGITTQPMTCNQAVCALLPNNNVPYSILYMFARNNKNILQNKAVGSAQQNISQVIIKDMSFIFNDKAFFDFNRIIEPMLRQIETNYLEAYRLATIRDTLLPKLMSGELKVK